MTSSVEVETSHMPVFPVLSVIPEPPNIMSLNFVTGTIANEKKMHKIYGEKHSDRKICAKYNNRQIYLEYSVLA